MKINLFITSLLLLFIVSCSESKKEESLPLGIKKIISSEILQTSSYTYIKGKVNNSEIWLAVRKKDITAGEIFYYDSNKSLEMHNFKSRELDRVFTKIFFLDKIMNSLTENNTVKKNINMGKTAFLKKNIKIESSKEYISISELFKNSKTYKDKIVKLKAQVTKFTPNIMNRNWIHIQDGTEYNNKYDITITSDQSAKINDIIILEGVLRINKDFGAGYKYECIIENAKINKIE